MSNDSWPTPLPRPGEAIAGPGSRVFELFAAEGETTSPTPSPEAHQPRPEPVPLGPSDGRRSRLGPLKCVAILVVCVWIIVTPLVSSVTELRQNTEIIVLVLAVLGVNIATGYGGMISLGHGVFVAVGAFGAAYAVDDLALPWAVSILLGAAVAGAAGAVIGLPALRIKGIHLALVTLGLAVAFQPLAKRFPALTGGVSGRPVGAELTPPAWFGSSRWAEGLYHYLICLAIVGAAIWLTHNLIHSQPGRAMRAVRDDDTAAAVHGVHLVATRVSTFAVSAALAGLAGALNIILVPFASQESYPAQRSLVLYAVAVLGGLGSIWGSVAGVAIRETASAIGRFLAEVDGLGLVSQVFDLLDDERFIFGAALIALTLAFPRGLVGQRVARIHRPERSAFVQRSLRKRSSRK